MDTRGWGPAGNTGRGWSWLRSGREHWAGMVAVEVRQGTLGVDARGWGPAGNTVDRGSQLDEDDEDDEDDKDDKDDKEDEEERRRGGGGGRGRRQEEAGGGRRRQEEATDIKSNNPHLAGGEKKKHLHFFGWYKLYPQSVRSIIGLPTSDPRVASIDMSGPPDGMCHDA